MERRKKGCDGGIEFLFAQPLAFGLLRQLNPAQVYVEVLQLQLIDSLDVLGRRTATAATMWSR